MIDAKRLRGCGIKPASELIPGDTVFGYGRVSRVAATRKHGHGTKVYFWDRERVVGGFHVMGHDELVCYSGSRNAPGPHVTEAIRLAVEAMDRRTKASEAAGRAGAWEVPVESVARPSVPKHSEPVGGAGTPGEAAESAYHHVIGAYSSDPIAQSLAWNRIASAVIRSPRAGNVTLAGCKPLPGERPGQAAKRVFDEIQAKRESGEFHLTAAAFWGCVAAEAIAAHRALDASGEWPEGI